MSKTIVRAKGGSGEHVANLEDIQVPDIWHIAQTLKDPARLKDLSRVGNRELAVWSGDEVLKLWHLCHDLVRHIRDEEEAKRRPGESIPDYVTRLSENS